MSPPKTGDLFFLTRVPSFDARLKDWFFSLAAKIAFSLQLAHSFFEEKSKLLFWFLSFSGSWSEGPLS